MKDAIVRVVKEFLEAKKVKGPLLLGFSGGTDSLALFHILYECRQFFAFDLHVAHVDHGWREESAKEAQQLKKEIENLSIPFHLHRLSGGCRGEEKARQDRFSFFSSLYQKLHCQALLLAHHGNDQSETVLKRVLEGANFLTFSGIQKKTILEGMTVWRPLLGILKKELQVWLDARGLKPLQDPTSFDLRSRMRKEIFPDLEKQFGKKISSNLQRLAASAQELKEYLHRKITPYFALVQGEQVDLSSLYPLEKMELKTFLKEWTEKRGCPLSHAALETASLLVQKGNTKKKIVSSTGKFLEIHHRTVAIKK